jgi:hypothetical protein
VIPPISPYEIKDEQRRRLDVPFRDIFWIVLKVELALALITLPLAIIVALILVVR